MTKNKYNQAVWSKRVKKKPSLLFQEIGSSIDVDKRLFKEDIIGSLAHIEMLNKQKIITPKIKKKISKGLKKIKKEILKKKVIICDRFIDSTSAYQVFGKGVDKKLVDAVHHHILRDVKPDLTFVLKVNINVAMQRLKKRKNKNRYDKFSKDFYNKVQKAFFTIANKNKKRCILIDNSVNSNTTEKLILKTFIKKFKK